MKAFLITYNPIRRKWEDLEEKSKKICEGNISVTESWPDVDRETKKGDRLFLILQGEGPRGIMASGHAVSNSYMKQPAYARGFIPHVDVEFDWIIDPKVEKILTLEDLSKNMPGQIWSPIKPSIDIKEEFLDRLERLWAGYVGTKNNEKNVENKDAAEETDKAGKDNKIYDLLKNAEDIDPNKCDGSYELVRETVNSYSHLRNLSLVDFADLDLIYLMSVIQNDKLRNQKLINGSNLPPEEKTRLTSIFNKVWEKARNKDYKIIAKPPVSIGMFGTGFYTFNKTISDKDMPIKIIRTLVEILPMTDFSQIYRVIKNNLNEKINGIGVASFSSLAHCLKPTFFPIMNANEGFGSVFSSLGIEIGPLKTIGDYADACKKIIDYRDKNFSFKNFKVMDDMARKIGKAEKYNVTLERGVKRKTFIVFQGDGKIGFQTEYAGRYIEAPYKDVGGGARHHWNRLEEVSKGDIVFHAANQRIVAVSIAEGKQYQNPNDPSQRRVNCDYTIISQPVELSKYRDKIISICMDQEYAPFNKNGMGNQGYLFYIRKKLAQIFAEDILKNNPGIKAEYLKEILEYEIIDDVVYISDGENMDNQEIALNTILYGPPGTGKTYHTKKYAVAICLEENLSDVKGWEDNEVEEFYKDLEEENRIVFTTFHQSYGYEDFIEGIKPESDTATNQVSYPVKPGVFKRFCEVAAQEDNKDRRFVFVIDEINRGNVSKIFGELITLIEPNKRLGAEEETKVELPYSKEKFCVPSNVYILGTMNTADRSIALLDTALRRRFDFVEMMPESQVLEDIGANEIVKKAQRLDIVKMLDTINNRIEVLYDREHTIGHAFFTGLIGEKATLENLRIIFENRVVPLLQEYFYENYEKIQIVLGDNQKGKDEFKFILEKEIRAKEIFKGNIDDSNIPEKKYSINKEAFKHIESYISII